MTTPEVICIDLGNINTRIALATVTGPTLCQLGSSGRSLQTIVGFTDDGRRYGHDAVASLIRRNSATYTSILFFVGEHITLLSTDRFSFISSYIPGLYTKVPGDNVGFCVNDAYHPADFLFTTLLSHSLGFVGNEASEPQPVVLTYQPYWPLNKIRRIIVATESIKRQCIGMYSQHLALGVNSMMTLLQRDRERLKEGPKLIAIMDVGEFSSFFSIYNVDHRLLEVIFINYQRELGSHDFDRCLCNIFLEKLRSSPQKELYKEFQDIDAEGGKPKNKKSLLRLIQAAREAKKILTVNNVAPMTVEGIGEMGETISFSITSKEFEQATQPLCNELVNLMTTDILNKVVMLQFTGGGSRVPAIRNAVEKALTGRYNKGSQTIIDKTINPDTALAEGTAWLSILTLDHFQRKAEFVIKDVSCYSILLECCSENRAKVYTKDIEIFGVGDYYPLQNTVTIEVPDQRLFLRVYSSTDEDIASFKIVPPLSRSFLNSKTSTLALSFSMSYSREVTLERATMNRTPVADMSCVGPDMKVFEDLRIELETLNTEWSDKEQMRLRYNKLLNSLQEKLYSVNHLKTASQSLKDLAAKLIAQLDECVPEETALLNMHQEIDAAKKREKTGA